jgi:hypothetical protein
LSDQWISHIEETKDQPPQMGKMGNASSRAFHGGEEFDQTEEDDEVSGTDGKEKVDVDEAIGKEPTESEKYPVDGSGGPNDRDALIDKRGEENRTDTRTDPAE